MSGGFHHSWDQGPPTPPGPWCALCDHEAHEGKWCGVDAGSRIRCQCGRPADPQDGEVLSDLGRALEKLFDRDRAEIIVGRISRLFSAEADTVQRVAHSAIERIVAARMAEADRRIAKLETELADTTKRAKAGLHALYFDMLKAEQIPRGAECFCGCGDIRKDALAWWQR